MIGRDTDLCVTSPPPYILKGRTQAWVVGKIRVPLILDYGRPWSLVKFMVESGWINATLVKLMVEYG